MLIKESIILSIMGRSGTTILRNELGKYKNICTLPTKLQEDLYKEYPKNTKFCSYYLKDLIGSDIANIYGIFDDYKQLSNIDTICFKTPLHNVLYYGNIDVLKRFMPILIIRNPVDNVISSCQRRFVKISRNSKDILNFIKNSYKILGLQFPENLVNNFQKQNIFIQKAILYKLSFESTFYYLNSVYQNKYLIVKFEELLKQPVEVLSEVLKFLNIGVTKEVISGKLKAKIYKDVTEEGGIQMSSNLTPSHLNKYSNIDIDIRNSIKRVLEKEITFYNNL